MKKIRILALCLILITAIAFTMTSCDSAANKNDAYMGGAEIAPEAPGESGSIGTNIGSSLEDNSDYQRKIIKTARISAQTLSFDESVTLIEELCDRLGGYIESSSVSGNGVNSKTTRYADYTIRIPAENLDGFNDGVGEILKVTSSSSNSDEVTNKYYDIKSRIEVLKMEKEALTELYEKYTDYGNIGYLIEIQTKLYDVIAEIESYETQIRLYDSKIAYSTVYLSIREVEEYVEVKETFGEKILGALEGGWDAFGDVCSALAIAFVACLPFTITGGAIAIGIIVLVKSIKKRNRKRKLEEQQEEIQK